MPLIPEARPTGETPVTESSLADVSGLLQPLLLREEGAALLTPWSWSALHGDPQDTPCLPSSQPLFVSRQLLPNDWLVLPPPSLSPLPSFHICSLSTRDVGYTSQCDCFQDHASLPPAAAPGALCYVTVLHSPQDNSVRKCLQSPLSGWETDTERPGDSPKVTQVLQGAGIPARALTLAQVAPGVQLALGTCCGWKPSPKGHAEVPTPL